MSTTANLPITSDQAEELLNALRFRFYQDRTQKADIDLLGKSIELFGVHCFGWSPGVWERTLQPPVKVSIRRMP